jgi:hypothetical protein
MLMRKRNICRSTSSWTPSLTQTVITPVTPLLCQFDISDVPDTGRNVNYIKNALLVLHLSLILTSYRLASSFENLSRLDTPHCKLRTRLVRGAVSTLATRTNGTFFVRARLLCFCCSRSNTIRCSSVSIVTRL